MKKGSGGGSKTNMVSNKVTNQGTRSTGQGQRSAMQGTAVGSGSRPGKSRFTIDSSNPTSSQMIRPKNKIEGTGYKG